MILAHEFGKNSGSIRLFREEFEGNEAFLGNFFWYQDFFRKNLGNTLIILGPKLRKKLGGTGLFRKMSFFREKIGGIMVDWGDIQGNFGLESYLYKMFWCLVSSKYKNLRLAQVFSLLEVLNTAVVVYPLKKQTSIIN